MGQPGEADPPCAGHPAAFESWTDFVELFFPRTTKSPESKAKQLLRPSHPVLGSQKPKPANHSRVDGSSIPPVPGLGASALTGCGGCCLTFWRKCSQARGPGQRGHARRRRQAAPPAATLGLFGWLHKTDSHFFWPLWLPGAVEGGYKESCHRAHQRKANQKSLSRCNYLLCAGEWLGGLPRVRITEHWGEREIIHRLVLWLENGTQRRGLSPSVVHTENFRLR